MLEAAEEALIARAWLADQARHSIEVQYFIWSTDNIGILAAEAMLRAAERGVRVRIIVDDLLIDAPDESLLALSMHPNIDIRIYNPKSSVGVPWHTRIWNALSDFRGLNQRMHDKTFIVDGRIAITGGRNMAAEYFDYDHEYNFRDRDAVMSDPAVELFGRARARGVRIQINTNSLASTDNLQAFSGYRNDRERLLEMGLEIHEYRPDPRTQLAVMRRELLKAPLAANRKPPIFGLHAKTMVVDSQLVYIGTFNLDPRSENLNTEVGVIVDDAALAATVEAQMELDMKPGNSWNAATDDPDRHASLIKRVKVWCWQLLPLEPLL